MRFSIVSQLCYLCFGIYSLLYKFDFIEEFFSKSKPTKDLLFASVSQREDLRIPITHVGYTRPH